MFNRAKVFCPQIFKIMVIDNNFIKTHDRLVRVIVNQYHVSGVDPEDLMQEGRIGLIEAAKPAHTSGCILVHDAQCSQRHSQGWR